MKALAGAAAGTAAAALLIKEDKGDNVDRGDAASDYTLIAEKPTFHFPLIYSEEYDANIENEI